MACWHPSLSIYILTLLSLLFATPHNPFPDPAISHIHTALSEFLHRGQLAIEVFPPLSLFLGAYLSAFSLSCIKCVSQAGLMAIVGHLYPRHTMLYYFGVGLLVFSGSMGPSDPIAVGSDCSDLLLVLAIATTFQPDVFPRSFYFIPAEIWIILAILFNWPNVDLDILCILFIMKRFIHTSRKLGDRYTSVLQVFINMFRTFIYVTAVALCVLVTVFTITYPASEQQAGGNYNLRYLSPSVRRSARSFAAFSQKESTKDRLSIPRHSLTPEKPISLYIPQTGFLWTDSKSWSDDHGVFLPSLPKLTTFSRDHAGRVDPHWNFTHRAIFSDQIRRVEPWILQQAMKQDENDLDNEAITSYIWPKEQVYLRSHTSGGFLSVEGGKRSIVDSVLHIEHDPEDIFQRWRVSVSSIPDPLHSVWTLYYDPHHDRGFRLYNAASACFVATSYRSFPDWDGLSRNDSVLRELRLELEATCSSGVTYEASTLFVIDGYSVYGHESGEDRNAVWLWLENLRVEAFHHSIEVVLAMWRLHRFRSKFASLQDTPPELGSSRYRGRSSPSSQLAIYSLTALITAYVSCCLALKRRQGHLRLFATNEGPAFPVGQRLAERRMNYHLCVWFTILYRLRYGVFTPEERPGVRVVMFISMIGWKGLLDEIENWDKGES